MSWIKCELHTHTFHSDGFHSIDELTSKAKDLFDIQCLALTDHNTSTGNEELIQKCCDLGICPIPGIELTTFYGHFVYLGEDRYVEWRDLTVDNFEDIFQNFDKGEGLLGIAHPRRLADPISTGSMFNYRIDDYSLFDYTEVWTRSNPTSHPESERNMEFWVDLLDQGYHITGLSGRDWHIGGEEDFPAFTYVRAKEINRTSVLASIKNGDVQCSYGPQLNLYGNRELVPFGSLLKGSMKQALEIEVSWFDGELGKKEEITEMTLEVQTNQYKESIDLGELGVYSLEIKEPISYMFFKIYGNYKGQRQMIAFTNPVYLEE